MSEFEIGCFVLGMATGATLLMMIETFLLRVDRES